MAWQLDESINVGDIDPNGPYQQVKIVRQTYDAQRMWILVEIQYGNTVDGAWVRGFDPVGAATSYMIKDADFIEVVTTHTSQDGELTYNAVKRGLYEYLATKGVIQSGTLV